MSALGHCLSLTEVLLYAAEILLKQSGKAAVKNGSVSLKLHFVERSFKLVKLCANKLWNFNFLIAFKNSLICLFSGFFLFLVLNRLVITLSLLRLLVNKCLSVSDYINRFDKVAVVKHAVCVVLEQGSDFKNTNDGLLMSLVEVIEEIGNNVHKCADSSHDNHNGHHIIEKSGFSRINVKNIKRLCITVVVVNAVSLLNERNNRRCEKRYDITDCCNRSEHTVDSLARTVLLIVTNIRLNSGSCNLLKRTDKPVEVNAGEQPPNVTHTQKHWCNEQYVEHIYADKYLFLTPFSDTDRSKQHSPKGSVTGKRTDKCVCSTVTGMTVCIWPLEDCAVSTLQEAEPACASDNPEIFVLCNLTEWIHKADLNCMCFSLYDFLLGICINDNCKSDTDKCEYGIRISVNSDVIKVVVWNNLCNNRKHDINNWRSKWINNRFDCKYVRSLLSVRRKNVNKVCICVVEEVEEELQQQAEQQYHCALDYIACFFSEKHIREKVVHSFVREPDVCYCNQCRGNTHWKNVRSVLTALTSCVVDNIRSDTRQRDIGKSWNQVEYVHIRRRYADSSADNHVLSWNKKCWTERDNEIRTDTAACVSGNFLVGHIAT